jgi:hypothetical protein
MSNTEKDRIKKSRDNYPTEFIQYYTGDFPDTIEECYQTWLRIKDSPDFEEFHPQNTENQ